MALPARIIRLSGILSHLATALMGALPLLVAFWAVRGHQNPGWLAEVFPQVQPGTTLTPEKSTWVLTIGALQLLPMLFALWHMRALFRRYSAGDILTAPCARDIRCIGTALATLALIQIVSLPLQIALLTLDNPPGARQLTFALSSENLWLLLAGGLLVVIGWAMAEAVVAAEENRGFI
ncbi:Protein of unknown function [Gemmobacter aquatilis]|uniref:DUF2975 domain-containing protein n=1 Tax=Gemmobacter aquatilis TaxID=933059 RepID=A0A1H8L848_9RHOB|nr:DUF2975 domain-containing protein [Gemmobacter aquatilis]SEO01342.1 Protein of unknown function [Gemmobacter aquatilis]